jgi:DNA-binding IclR family transcriptional regulator
MSLVIGKALKLIDLVASGTDTLAALTEAAKLSRSTAHRILSVLVASRYLAIENRRYVLGYKFLEFGEKKKRNLDFVEIALEIMQDHARATSDTVHLGILDGRDIVLVGRIAGSRPLQIGSFVGLRAPAYKTALGKVLIGQLPQSQWQRFLDDIPVSHCLKAKEIAGHLETARRHNYAIDMEECDEGVFCVASSFRIEQDRWAAVSFNGASVYFPEQRVRELVACVRQCAATIASAFRGNPDAKAIRRAKGRNERDHLRPQRQQSR